MGWGGGRGGNLTLHHHTLQPLLSVFSRHLFSILFWGMQYAYCCLHVQCLGVSLEQLKLRLYQQEHSLRIKRLIPNPPPPHSAPPPTVPLSPYLSSSFYKPSLFPSSVLHIRTYHICPRFLPYIPRHISFLHKQHKYICITYQCWNFRTIYGG